MQLISSYRKYKYLDETNKADNFQTSFDTTAYTLVNYADQGRDIVFDMDFKGEVKKVVWPTRREAMGGTAVVLVVVFLVALFLGIVDSILSKIVQGMITWRVFRVVLGFLVHFGGFEYYLRIGENVKYQLSRGST